MIEPRINALSGYHSPQVDVEVRLNTNESPLPPPAGWFEVMYKAVEDLAPHRYPDRGARQLRSRIAELHGVEPENVWCANGSNEVIQNLLMAFGGPERTSVVFEPTYALHSHISNLVGMSVVTGQRNSSTFALDAASVAALAPEADICFTCSPNNPTGTVDDAAVLDAALANARGLVVADEAYGQFATNSAIKRVGEQSPLVVLRTFSKTWAMAGLRLGYMIAPTSVVASAEAASLPYHLSTLTQAAGLAALDFEVEMQERISELVSERRRVQAALVGLDVAVWPSEANFILFRPTIDGAAVWQRLVERSVLVRDTSSWAGLSGCLRVTIGTKNENDRFLAALEESLQ